MKFCFKKRGLRLAVGLAIFFFLGFFGYTQLTVKFPEVSAPGYKITIPDNRIHAPWVISVDPVKKQILKGKHRWRGEAKQEFLYLHASAGNVFGSFLQQRSPNEIEEKLRHLTNSPALSFDDLTRKVQIGYVANGRHKVVYRVIFGLRDHVNGISVVLKMFKGTGLKRKNRFSERNALRSLGGNEVPKLWDYLPSEAEDLLIEEFIGGVNLKTLEVQNKHTPALRRKTITVLAHIYDKIGSLPQDVRYENMMLEKHGEQRERMVNVDREEWQMTHPAEILETLHDYYGLSDKEETLEVFLRGLPPEKRGLFSKQSQMKSHLRIVFCKRCLCKHAHPFIPLKTPSE